MRLEFGDLLIEGFKAFAKPQRLDFESFPVGVHFIRGLNTRVRRVESNGCLLGNTLVDCPRDLSKYPKGIPIKELLKRKDFWTYSWDFEQDTLTLAKVKRVWRTGKKKVCKVTLSAYPKGKTKVGNRAGGTQQGKYLPPCELIGTYDHPVLLCDGTWKKLGELQLGDSLKSLYRREADRGKLSWSRQVHNEYRGYIYYGLTETISEQQFICETLLGPRPPSTHAHHKDGNKYNHSPDNLEWKDAHQHISDHNKERALRSPVANHEVVAIEHIGKRHVYDMEVERTHNFVANGVFVHNSAKSTIFDAASWCLFGRTVEGLRNPDVAPWSDPKATTCVSWTVRIDDKAHIVLREANPNTLLLDGQKASQEDIIKLVCTPGVFNHAILLGQDQKLFFDLTATGKMDVFTEAMPSLERWVDYSNTAASIIEGMERKKLEISSTVTDLEGRIDQIKQFIKHLTNESADWLKLRRERLNLTAMRVGELNKELAKRGELLAKAELTLDSANTEYDALEREARKIVDERSDARREHDLALAEINRVRSDLTALGEADTCPTCGQSLKGTNLAKHKKELQRQLNGELAEKLSLLTAELHTIDKMVITIEANLKSFKKKTIDAQAEVNLHKPDVIEIRKEITTLSQSLTDAEAEVDLYRSQLVDNKRELRAMEDELATAYSDLTKLDKRIARTSFWVKGFKEIRLLKIEEILTELQLVSNTMLADLGLEDWQLSYAVEKETKSGTIQRGITVFIESPDSKRPVRWEAWSGGERQRLRIIGALALGEVLLSHAGVVPSMVVLDEPTRNLSEEGVEDLCTFLSERAKTLGQRIMLIDHMANPTRHFASTVTVVKGKDGTARIALGEP